MTGSHLFAQQMQEAGLGEWDPYKAPEMDLGERPNQFGDLDPAMRRSIRSQALAAIGARMLSAPPGMGMGQAGAGVADALAYRNNAVRQAGLDWDSRQRSAALLSSEEARQAQMKAQEITNAKTRLELAAMKRSGQEALADVILGVGDEARRSEYQQLSAVMRAQGVPEGKIAQKIMENEATIKKAEADALVTDQHWQTVARYAGADQANFLRSSAVIEDNVREEALEMAFPEEEKPNYHWQTQTLPDGRHITVALTADPENGVQVAGQHIFGMRSGNDDIDKSRAAFVTRNLNILMENEIKKGAVDRLAEEDLLSDEPHLRFAPKDPSEWPEWLEKKSVQMYPSPGNVKGLGDGGGDPNPEDYERGGAGSPIGPGSGVEREVVGDGYILSARDRQIMNGFKNTTPGGGSRMTASQIREKVEEIAGGASNVNIDAIVKAIQDGE